MPLIALIFVIFGCSTVNGIHNGTKVNRHEHPYMVFVQSPKFFCAGALISDRHVLTAAHCLMTISKGGVAKVGVGAHKYYGYGQTDGVYYESRNFWMHENFRMPSAVFDIGIIELPQRLTVSDKTRPIGISTKKNAENDIKDLEVLTCGWGYDSNYDHSDELVCTKMNLFSWNECIKYKSNYIENLNEDHICAVKFQGHPCDGDSGAPIISTKTNKIVGILSYGKDAENGVELPWNDCKAKTPDVSTRISSVVDWISEKTGINFRD